MPPVKLTEAPEATVWLVGFNVTVGAGDGVGGCPDNRRIVGVAAAWDQGARGVAAGVWHTVSPPDELENSQ